MRISEIFYSVQGEGSLMGVPFGLTHSCYDPDDAGHACGACDSCLLRRRGFEQAGQKDPTRYHRG